MAAIAVWDAGTDWKLPVLQAILDQNPKKLNQVSSFPPKGGREVLNGRDCFPSM